MPSRAEKASTGAMPKVSGMRRATPMAAVRPGRAPKMIPRATPMRLASRALRLRALIMPSRMFANMSFSPGADLL